MKKEELYYQILNLGIKINKIENIDQRLENIIKRYYTRDIFFSPYHNSVNMLVRMLIEGEFPTVEEWNNIADKEGCFSHISLEYIAECNWKQLKNMLIKEIKDILMA